MRIFKQVSIITLITFVLIHFAIGLTDRYIPLIRLDTELQKSCEPYADLNLDEAYPFRTIPHPYFGYVYTPNKAFVQQPVLIKSNSEGFIDLEFPRQKDPNIIVYGIIGGSAAMGWGVKTREERIVHFLEELLNEHSRRMGWQKKFRLLNLGIGGHIQYQASQIFYYYKHLLDGVITISGHNEIYKAQHILRSKDPVRYPHDWDSISGLPSQLMVGQQVKSIQKKIQNVCGNYSQSKWNIVKASRVVRLRRAFRALNKLNENVTEASSKLPKPFDNVASWMPSDNLDPVKLRSSPAPSYARARKEILGRVIPVVFTEPILDAFAVAKSSGVEFLTVFQPLIGIVDKKKSQQEMKLWDDQFTRLWGTPPSDELCKSKCPGPKYQIDGYQILRSEKERLQKAGVAVLDTNRPGFFAGLDGESVFSDIIHLNSLGNQRVAQGIYQEIIKRWALFREKGAGVASGPKVF